MFVHCPLGYLFVDGLSGWVLDRHLRGRRRAKLDYWDITRFDTDSYCREFHVENPDPDVDIADIGYWCGTRYVKPDPRRVRLPKSEK